MSSAITTCYRKMQKKMKFGWHTHSSNRMTIINKLRTITTPTQNFLFIYIENGVCIFLPSFVVYVNVVNLPVFVEEPLHLWFVLLNSPEKKSPRSFMFTVLNFMCSLSSLSWFFIQKSLALFRLLKFPFQLCAIQSNLTWNLFVVISIFLARLANKALSERTKVARSPYIFGLYLKNKAK